MISSLKFNCVVTPMRALWNGGKGSMIQWSKVFKVIVEDETLWVRIPHPATVYTNRHKNIMKFYKQIIIPDSILGN